MTSFQFTPILTISALLVAVVISQERTVIDPELILIKGNQLSTEPLETPDPKTSFSRIIGSRQEADKELGEDGRLEKEDETIPRLDGATTDNDIQNSGPVAPHRSKRFNEFVGKRAILPLNPFGGFRPLFNDNGFNSKADTMQIFSKNSDLIPIEKEQEPDVMRDVELETVVNKISSPDLEHFTKSPKWLNFVGNLYRYKLDRADSKRQYQYLGKRHSEDMTGLPKPIGAHDVDNVLKRYDLIGKKNEESQVNDKRYNFIGKRYELLGKRYDFVGKRYNFIGKKSDEKTPNEKRYYDLLGKRSYSLIGKRNYNFVGKRNYNFVGKRNYNFVGKRNYNFVGKRGDLEEDKRYNFIGKRSFDNLVGDRDDLDGKRSYNLVGKRDDLDGKRSYNLVGKREDEAVKRYNFIGKRYNFIGKRKMFENGVSTNKMNGLISEGHENQQSDDLNTVDQDNISNEKHPYSFVDKKNYQIIGKRTFQSETPSILGDIGSDITTSKRYSEWLGKRTSGHMLNVGSGNLASRTRLAALLGNNNLRKRISKILLNSRLPVSYAHDLIG